MQLTHLLAALCATAVVSSTPLPERLSSQLDHFVSRSLDQQAGNGAWAILEERSTSSDAGLVAQRDASGLQTLAERIVYNPRITFPTGGETWIAGTSHNVTWDVSNLPQGFENAKSTLKLGYTTPDGQGGLNEKWTLADGFFTRDGVVTFTLPDDLPQIDSAIVVLFGDSGNKSPSFQILPASSDEAPAPPASYDDVAAEPEAADPLSLIENL